MEDATILEWKVSVGDQISQGDTLVEIEADKISAEIEAPVTGVVKEIRAKEGNAIDVGTVIAVIEPDEI